MSPWHVLCDAPILVQDFRVRIEELVAQNGAARARYHELLAIAQEVMADAEARLIRPASSRNFQATTRPPGGVVVPDLHPLPSDLAAVLAALCLTRR